MRTLLAILLVVACEKSAPVEATPGSSSTSGSSSPVTPRGLPDAAVATLPSDAQKPDAVPAADDDDGDSIADLMTANGPDGGDMNHRQPGRDLADQIKGTRGSGASAGSAVPRQKAPTGRVMVRKKEAFDDTMLTLELVLSKMSSTYMSGIKGCYKTYLAKDPSARGKIRLTFTVNEAGRTLMPTAKGFASEIDTCLTQRMTAWLFPRPKDRDGAATEASFAFELNLVPD